MISQNSPCTTVSHELRQQQKFYILTYYYYYLFGGCLFFACVCVVVVFLCFFFGVRGCGLLVKGMMEQPCNKRFLCVVIEGYNFVGIATPDCNYIYFFILIKPLHNRYIEFNLDLYVHLNQHLIKYYSITFNLKIMIVIIIHFEIRTHSTITTF